MAAKQPPRKPIPPEIQHQVLTKSRRRCALCFGLDGKTDQRNGQIAHLDRRRSNSIEDNLAFLCLDHHSQYDSKPSQHKGYTIEEVKSYRDSLYRRVRKGISPSHSKAGSKSPNGGHGKARTRHHVTNGPEIVLEYEYADNSKENNDSNRPLVLRNASTTAAAYNVEVLPLNTDHGSAEFEPKLITCIVAGEKRNVFADLTGGSPLFSRRLPDLLAKSYADESVEELIGAKKFILRVQYQGTDPEMVIETECELLFRPWKRKTSIGRISRRVMRRVPVPKSDSSPTLAQQELPERRPKVTPVFYGKTPDGHEGVQLSNEGTPAYDIQIEPINLNDGWSVTFDEINRLAEEGFSRSFISRNNEGILSLWGLWRHGSQPPVVPFVIKYRDFGGRWYRSFCELHRDVMKKSGFDVKFIRQE